MNEPIKVEVKRVKEKPWWKRRTMWAGLAAIATAVCPFFGASQAITTGVLGIIGGLAIIFGRQAIEETKRAVLEQNE